MRDVFSQVHMPGAKGIAHHRAGADANSQWKHEVDDEHLEDNADGGDGIGAEQRGEHDYYLECPPGDRGVTTRQTYTITTTAHRGTYIIDI